jgi:hypothetical protein
MTTLLHFIALPLVREGQGEGGAGRTQTVLPIIQVKLAERILLRTERKECYIVDHFIYSHQGGV